MREPTDPIMLHLLGSGLRVRLLTALLSEPGRRPWLRELGRETGCGLSSLSYELAQLKELGLINDHREGGARFFRVNELHPLCAPLRALIFASKETASWLKLPCWERPGWEPTILQLSERFRAQARMPTES